MSEEAHPGPPAEPPFAGRFLRCALLCLPVAYVAHVLGAVIHEIAGHGLVASLCGGAVRAFEIDAWGSGRTLLDDRGCEMRVLVAGSAAETIAGLLAGFVAGRLRPGGMGRVAALLLAGSLLSNACFGVFLGGFPALEGSDFGRMARLLGDPRWSALFLVAGGSGFLAAN